LGLEKFSDYLIPYLEDEQDILKIAATKALAQMGCKRALPELKKLRRERNKDIVEAAETAVLSLERGRR
jgi:HEAT repeat protein